MAVAAPRIVVVGAGIVGASVAYHLARRGARVTLLDRGGPAGGVTSQSFAWINVVHGVPSEQIWLRQRAIAEHRRLQQELAARLAIDWCGALTWRADPATTEAAVRAHAACGYDVRLVEREEIRRLEPGLTCPPLLASFAAGEGALDPAAATQAMVAAVQEFGAELCFDCPVLALVTASGKIAGVGTADGHLAADVVVLAAGVEAARLCQPLDVALPVTASPAILVRLRASGRPVQRIVSGPAMEIRPAGDSLILAAEDYLDETPENGPSAVADRLLATLRGILRGGADITLKTTSVGQRPMPADGAPIIGFTGQLPGLYLATMHAGVVLAPLVGRLAAGEILDGREEDALRGCRLERFSPAVSPP